MSPFLSDPAGPAGSYVAGGPVGPYGTLSPFHSDPAGPAGQYVAVGPFGILFLFNFGSAILVDPGGGTLLPGEGGPKSCPGVLTDDLVLVAAVPLPAVRDPRVASSPVEVMVGDCDTISNDTTLSCVDECTEWDTQGVLL